MRSTSPALMGVRASDIKTMLDVFNKHGVTMHSLLMARGENCFFERYWAPYDADTPHRLYSVTKSFVSVAVGLLAQDGKLCLDDPIIGYFPDKLPPIVPRELREQTIRDMLRMCTCFVGSNWFLPEVKDRLTFYFSQTPTRPAGTLFDYDSTGSYVLGVLVERLSGMPLLDFLRARVLDEIGGFENAQLLKVMDGTPWGDSGFIATPRALMRFARFVLNGGVWHGKRLMQKEYLAQATTMQTDNSLADHRCQFDQYGYGYQFWMTEQNGFAFYGMGGQLAICVPHKDFIFVCTGDNQGSDKELLPIVFDTVFKQIVSRMADTPLKEEAPLPEETGTLPVARGKQHVTFAKAISGATFRCSDNPMGIRWFRLELTNSEGVFIYKNAQGEKRLPFGLGHNIIGPFPQAGYSSDYGNVHQINDFRYRCAASAGWIEPQKLQLSVQIIDRYFGRLVVTFGFRDENVVGVRMIKAAEDFLNEYQGWMSGSFTPFT